jgi:hypothetical protein
VVRPAWPAVGRARADGERVPARDRRVAALAAAEPSWAELGIGIALILVVYGVYPRLVKRLAVRRRRDGRERFDLARPGASLEMAGGLVLGYGIVALAFGWWWFSAVTIIGGALLLGAARLRRRRP